MGTVNGVGYVSLSVKCFVNVKYEVGCYIWIGWLLVWLFNYCTVN